METTSVRFHVILFAAFCLVGTALELSFGILWSVVGDSPWIYPDSPLHYTSIVVLPLWGFGGLICVSVYQALLHKKARFLLMATNALSGTALWIMAYSVVMGFSGILLWTLMGAFILLIFRNELIRS